MSQIQFDQGKLQEFNRYREQRLENVPLDKLCIEPIREPTPSISISGSSGEENSKSKSERESAEKSNKQSNSEHSRSEGSIKGIAQSIETPDQQVLSPKQVETPGPLAKPTSPIVVDREKESGNFNELINTEEQSAEPLIKPGETATKMIIEEVIYTQKTKHIPVAPSSKIVLKIEEIPHLDVFYSPQHKAVVRRQRKKRKIDIVISPEAEPLDVLWQDPNTNPMENLTRLS